MKITALVPESLIDEVRKYSGGKNVTESLIIALTDYANRQKLKRTIQKLKKNPLEFVDDFNAEKIRKVNRDL
jgi:hypothetical protein